MPLPEGESFAKSVAGAREAARGLESHARTCALGARPCGGFRHVGRSAAPGESHARFPVPFRSVIAPGDRTGAGDCAASACTVDQGIGGPAQEAGHGPRVAAATAAATDPADAEAPR